MRGVSLWGCDFSGADLYKVKCQGADLCGADLSAVHSLKGADFAGAIDDEDTLWPESFAPPATGARFEAKK